MVDRAGEIGLESRGGGSVESRRHQEWPGPPGPATWDGHPRCSPTPRGGDVVLATGQRSVRVSTQPRVSAPAAGGRVAAAPTEAGRTGTSSSSAFGAPTRRCSRPPAPGARAIPLGDRQLLSLGDRAFALEGGGVLRDVTIAYETWGTLADDASNAVLVCHALTGDSHAAGPLAPGHPTAGLVGQPHRPGPADRHRSVVRRVRQRARRLPGHHRARRARTPTTASRGGAASRSCRCATGCAARRPWPTTSASGAGTAWSVGRWAACRCSSGR